MKSPAAKKDSELIVDLLEGLETASTLMRDDQSSQGQRDGMMRGLIAVLNYLDAVVDDRPARLTYPIEQLLARLADVSRGIPVSDFKTETQHRPPDGVLLSAFKRNCAEALSLYMRNGKKKAEAAKLMAGLLAPLGPIKPRTIAAWRDSLVGADVDDPSAAVYRDVTTSLDLPSIDTLNAQVTSLCEKFAGLNLRAQGNRVERLAVKQKPKKSD
jgi:hypothetical protein